MLINYRLPAMKTEAAVVFGTWMIGGFLSNCLGQVDKKLFPAEVFASRFHACLQQKATMYIQFTMSIDLCEERMPEEWMKNK